ncbi:unnamed protein product [Hymenolepis diminuta]|uniref:Uncharacterized protein n=1 Tax=Hymenolepis diminuta TaxID=6216 RepID=A0A564ZBN3_HYMDI|nr:unnamed protein product [Hymenolepis diminuta]
MIMANNEIMKETERLFNCAKRLELRQIIEPLNCTQYYSSFRVLRDPGGQFVILSTPDYPLVKPGWILTLGDKQMADTAERFPEAFTITQAFICCVYVILKGLQVEMPSVVIELDQPFKEHLDSIFSEDTFESLFS